MHSRKRQNLFLISCIITLLITTVITSTPVSALDTVLALNPQITTGVSPGSAFNITLTVDDVEYMLAFNLFIYYDTDVLTATNFGAVTTFPPSPLTEDLGSEINDTLGYVSLGYSYPLPEQYGLSTSFPRGLVWIEFSVDSSGTSLLDIRDSVISDIYGNPISHEASDGFFANVAVRNDVAVTELQISPIRNVMPGENVTINATVANQAPYDAEFDVTAHVNSTTLGPETVILPKLSETTVSFEWNTTGAAFGPHIVSAEASVVGNETDTADNTLSFDDVVVVGTHDVAVTAVTAAPTNMVFGEPLDINVTVANQGNFTEQNFVVNTTYSYVSPPPPPPGAPPKTVIKTETVPSLSAGNNITLSYTLDTSTVMFGDKKVVGIQITANASAVLYETETADNLGSSEPIYIFKEYARLKAPEVVNTSLEPGQTFSINITIAKVENMIEYEFYLHYNSTILNATSLTSYSPFTVQVQSTINNTEGWIYMNYETIDSTTVKTTVDPAPIAGITFNITGLGDTPLDLRNSKITTGKPLGEEIPAIAVDGLFANLLPPHDIKVSLETPSLLFLGDSSLLNVTVTNFGYYNETNVVSKLIINGTEVHSNSTNLLSLQSITWSYTWTPTAEGMYNITAYAPPVTGETQARTRNNNATSMVTVQLILPSVSFTYSPLSVFEGETVTFYATASSPGSSITSYKWDFDDGNITEVTSSIIEHIYTTNGTYTVRLTVTDGRGQSNNKTETLTIYRRDVAVLSVNPSAAEVIVGKSLTITAVVVNRGDSGTETFNVTLYYNDTPIQTKPVKNLAIAANKSVEFSWDTTGVSLGTYTIKAVATTVPKETNTTNNVLISDVSVTVVIRNVSITNVEASQTEVTVGDTVTITVTVVNKGNFTETFNVTVYYADTLIQTKPVTNLAPSSTQTLSFSWNTTEVNPGNYSLKGVASTVPDEADETDNTRIGPTVTVKEPPPTDTTLYILAVGIALAAAIILGFIWRTRKR